MAEMPQDFPSIKERLDRIAEEVAVPDIPFDEALALFDEAISLGLAACDMSEADLALEEAEPFEESATDDEAQDPAEGESPGAIPAPSESASLDAIAEDTRPIEATSEAFLEPAGLPSEESGSDIA